MNISIGMTLRTNTYEEFVGNTPKKIYGEVVDIVENEDGDIKVFLKVTDRIRYWYDLKELETPSGQSINYETYKSPPKEVERFNNEDLPF
jgi:hypothetical protein